MKKTLILVTVAALSLSGAAMAQETGAVLDYWGPKNIEQVAKGAHDAALPAGTVHSFIIQSTQSQVNEPAGLLGGGG